MDFRFWRRLMGRSGELQAVRAVRVATEAQLAMETKHVTVPLKDLRAENHIQEDLNKLIQRRVRREIGDA